MTHTHTSMHARRHKHTHTHTRTHTYTDVCNSWGPVGWFTDTHSYTSQCYRDHSPIGFLISTAAHWFKSHLPQEGLYTHICRHTPTHIWICMSTERREEKGRSSHGCLTSTTVTTSQPDKERYLVCFQLCLSRPRHHSLVSWPQKRIPELGDWGLFQSWVSSSTWNWAWPALANYSVLNNYNLACIYLPQRHSFKRKFVFKYSQSNMSHFSSSPNNVPVDSSHLKGNIALWKLM
jgi:hypothetical protein